MNKLTYEDYRDREYLIDKMIQAMYFLKEFNKLCIAPDANEKRTILFLNKALDNYFKSVNMAPEFGVSKKGDCNNV